MLSKKLKLLLFLCVLGGLCVSIPAQEWKTVADGVEHATVRREFGGKPVNINLLRLDLKKVRLDVHHAMDMAIGTEKTSSIATRHKAFAAINAGFFRLDTSIWAGDAVGILLIDGSLWSESSNNRIALWIQNARKTSHVEFGHAKTNIWVRVGSKTMELSGINRERKTADALLFTPSFGPRTLTNLDGREIAFSKCKSKDEPGWNGVLTCRNAEIKAQGGNGTIPKDGRILSLDVNIKDTHYWTEFLQELKKDKNQKLTMYIRDLITFGSKRLPESKNTSIVAGVPQLIKDGKIDITWEQEKASKAFVEARHPRTAVAKLKDGKFLMLTADGRTNESAGLDLYDLAAYMLELGATYAMNLDGGGSTTMFLDGKVVNHPSDKEGERKVSDALLVTLRKPINKRK